MNLRLISRWKLGQNDRGGFMGLLDLFLPQKDNTLEAIDEAISIDLLITAARDLNRMQRELNLNEHQLNRLFWRYESLKSYLKDSNRESINISYNTTAHYCSVEDKITVKSSICECTCGCNCNCSI